MELKVGHDIEEQKVVLVPFEATGSLQDLSAPSSLQDLSAPSSLQVQQFTCTQCGKALRDPHTLKCHIKTVHGEKKLSCDVCNKRFPHRGALNAHKKTHESASFTCNICNETIKDSSYFKKHVRAHSAPRPHQCGVCGKSYLQKSHLTVHMSIHSDQKPFTCPVCSKSFRLAKAFKEHKNMHDKIKNLKCPHCPYTSCFHKNMQTHIRNHVNKSKCQDYDNSSTRLNEDKITTLESNNEPMISKINLADSSQHQDTLAGEMESPVYLLVNLEPEENLSTPIHDMESLNLLEMAQELCITTDQPEKMSDDYRPLDLSIVREVIFCEDNSESAEPTDFSDNNRAASFDSLTLDANYATTVTTTERESSAEMTADEYLSYQAENPGRRRSVFLAEQLDYEHQGEMRVVDPAEVTG